MCADTVARMRSLSNRALSLSASPTLALDGRLKALAANGVQVLNLSVGEADFPPPSQVIEAAHRALDAGADRYTDVGGIVPLRTRIAEKLKAENDLDYSPDEIVVSCGAKHSLFNAFYAICEVGDEVLIPAPFWVSYPEQVKATGATPVLVSAGMEDGFKVTPDMLEAHTTPQTKALVLNSPGNPTGAVYDAAELAAIAEFVERHDLYVIEDLIYEHFYYGDEDRVHSIVEVEPQLRDRVVVVNGVSKAFGMTGWRIGYTATSRELTGVMRRAQSQMTSNPTAIAQHAATAALDHTPWDSIRAFRDRRATLLSALDAVDGITCPAPEGAFYAFPDVSGLLGRTHGETVLNTVDDVCGALLDAHRVGIVPGTGFAAPHHVRISYAVDPQVLSEALGRIDRFVSELSG